ncbi:MAG: bifunctional phosphoribosylaminoimidazolecarboxamide formyltransferase/IMP cyclohydrolase [Bacteroidia bacterium]|nr:bifunctional phosphoribosylaminoimidazolecarboxamide formyltransferase/IMP cyclohydrolase [Bacteroidia bacterium]MCZ2249833.1 bifunctional phosphoribosylaminoimidazolecarboxamide formyltransferase/IMP cyclohydrolase [Bacteroidia bacterium]
MNTQREIKNALISVYYKDNLEPILEQLKALNVNIYTTGGTQAFIEKQGIATHTVEKLTGYPSILGGRVKTLHPNVFGGILARKNKPEDIATIAQYNIPFFDLVIVDLYPFSETVASSNNLEEIIEKIDIGGISLIRAAAKNYHDVLIVSSRQQYQQLLTILINNKGTSHIEDRKAFAKEAFYISSQYDRAIFNYFADNNNDLGMYKDLPEHSLRYGENPHQKGRFYGHLDNMFIKHGGKEISYNNLLDIDAAINLIHEFNEPTIAILKHNNACGLATDTNLVEAWKKALAGDPVSAFGGVIICNSKVSKEVAEEMNKLFFEVLIATDFDNDSLSILSQKTNRILLSLKQSKLPDLTFRSLLNGVIEQDRDTVVETPEQLKIVTETHATIEQINDLLFANKIVKQSKSNCIVLAKNNQLIASGVGMTSRVDALKHAISKAHEFNFDLKGAVMASDAFFPFPDCVEIAYKAGISAIIQPGGSVKDNLSIDFCNKHQLAMVFTGVRHFKH